MIKYFCDCCEKEANYLYPFRYLVHLENEFGGYGAPQLDGTMQDVSGREENHALCLTCYNGIMRKSVTEYLKMKGDKS